MLTRDAENLQSRLAVAPVYFPAEVYPNLTKWINKMAQVPGYDVVHLPLAVLGDISEDAPSIEALKTANMHGFNALQGNS